MESRAWPVRVAFPFFPRFLPFSTLFVLSSLLFSSPHTTGRCFFAPSFSLSSSRLCLCPATNCVARPRATSTGLYALNVAQEDHGAARTMDLGRLAARWLADGVRNGDAPLSHAYSRAYACGRGRMYARVKTDMRRVRKRKTVTRSNPRMHLFRL